ncbi:MAG: hypothetical protein Phyf2KO_14200 [Phycisphaerales bacterium]
MLLTLHTDSVASMIRPSRKGAKPKLALEDLPAFARQTLDLHGLNITTDLLSGATPTFLEKFRERADKERCSCLLLIEPEPMELAHESDKIGNAGVDRIRKVLRAASILGCNAAAISIKSEDTEDFLDFTVDRFRQIVDTADKLDMNVLISPRKGLTEKPERVTELIKKIGGFRVGTFPDFESAIISGEPEAYLRKLVPYASVLAATTIELIEPEMPDEEEPPKKQEKKEAEPEEPKAEESEADLDAEMEEGEEDFRGDGLKGLLDAVMGAGDDDFEDEEPDPPVHKPYELQPLVDTVASVGFDGTIAVRYIGGDDASKGTDLSRWALEHAVGIATAKK